MGIDTFATLQLLSGYFLQEARTVTVTCSNHGNPRKWFFFIPPRASAIFAAPTPGVPSVHVPRVPGGGPASPGAGCANFTCMGGLVPTVGSCSARMRGSYGISCPILTALSSRFSAPFRALLTGELLSNGSHEHRSHRGSDPGAEWWTRFFARSEPRDTLWSRGEKNNQD